MRAPLLTELRRRKMLRFDDPTPPSELELGSTAKVVGVVRAAEEPWRAPFSGRPCVAFTVLGVRSDLAYRPNHLERTHDFWIDTHDGAVRVRPQSWCRYLVPPVRVDRTDPAAWAFYNDFCDTYGMHLRESLGGFADGMMFLERAVEVGIRVALVGEVAEPYFPSGASERGGGYRDRIQTPSLQPPQTDRLWISSYESHL